MSRYPGPVQHGRLFLAAFALVLLAGIAAASPGEVGQEGQVWNLGTQQNGRTYPTGITAFKK